MGLNILLMDKIVDKIILCFLQVLTRIYTLVVFYETLISVWLLIDKRKNVKI